MQIAIILLVDVITCMLYWSPNVQLLITKCTIIDHQIYYWRHHMHVILIPKCTIIDHQMYYYWSSNILLLLTKYILMFHRIFLISANMLCSFSYFWYSWNYATVANIKYGIYVIMHSCLYNCMLTSETQNTHQMHY